MSQVFLSNRLGAKYSLPLALNFPLLRQRGARIQPPRSEQRNVFLQQQRRYVCRSDTARPKSRFWICGVGVGIALAAGLKYYSDTANGSCADKVTADQGTDRFSDAIRVSRDLVERIKAEVGAPGLVVSVSVDGVQVWAEGIGYADLENRVPCSPDTVLRIASISKTLTSAAAARLCEEGKLDLDVPVQKYVPEFPQKQFDGQDVTITPRMILSHLSGIRHYEKDAEKVKEDREKAKRLLKPPTKKKEDKISTDQNSTDKKSSQPPKKNDSEYNEFYLKDNFESVIQALDLFKDDPLIFPPGTTFLYSTHAYTLLSAVLERAAGQSFLDLMKNMFSELGMVHTVPEENDCIIYHRSRFYHLNKRGRVVNSPYVDNSYKWAGGGFLSTAGDVLLLGNALLYSYQVAHLKDTEGLLPGFLNSQTAINLWTPVDRTEGTWDKEGLYAQGWLVVEKFQKYGQCRKRRHYMSHTGGAVGASSVILVLPSVEIEQRQGQTPILPQGVVVSIITNMQSVGLNSTALKIAHEFDKARRLQE